VSSTRRAVASIAGAAPAWIVDQGPIRPEVTNDCCTRGNERMYRWERDRRSDCRRAGARIRRNIGLAPRLPRVTSRVGGAILRMIAVILLVLCTWHGRFVRGRGVVVRLLVVAVIDAVGWTGVRGVLDSAPGSDRLAYSAAALRDRRHRLRPAPRPRRNPLRAVWRPPRRVTHCPGRLAPAPGPPPSSRPLPPVHMSGTRQTLPDRLYKLVGGLDNLCVDRTPRARCVS
jgi:hypothetical protein